MITENENDGWEDVEIEYDDGDNIDGKESNSKEKRKSKETKSSKEKSNGSVGNQNVGRAQKRIQSLIQKNKEKEKRIKELTEERNKLAEDQFNSRKSHASRNVETLQKALKEAKKSYAIALKEEKFEDAADLQETISEIKTNIMVSEAVKNEGGAPNKIEYKEDPVEDADEASDVDLSQYPEPAQRWAEKNMAKLQGNKALVYKAMAINEELQQEDFDPNSEEFYEELDRRLEGKSTSESDDNESGNVEEGTSSKTKTSPTTGVSRNASPGGRSKRRKIPLDSSEQRHAKLYGMDDKTWAKRKAQVEDADGGWVDVLAPQQATK